MIDKPTKLKLVRRIAMASLGKPYIWGGDDPLAGFDCSGFCIELLKSVGVLPRSGDWTAQRLYNRFIHNEVNKPREGCLAFWGLSSESITHVEYALDDTHTIGASGGGRRTITVQDAIDQNAYIKVRPWATRGGDALFVDPFQ